ncbi:MAG: hypothetical protein V7739_08625 [Motiliproteus sp.]
MHGISDSNIAGLPSPVNLVKATLTALLLAGALLVTAVLPAEYGIDPTGIGARVGLLVLNQSAAVELETGAGLVSDSSGSGVSSPVWKTTASFRSDSKTVTLQPNQGVELKAVMNAGEKLVFSWQVESGSVSFDMHGEKVNAGKEFTSYWQGENQSSASGEFEAPFEGTHGWYWQNKGTKPVTISLVTSGFYRALYMP